MSPRKIQAGASARPGSVHLRRAHPVGRHLHGPAILAAALSAGAGRLVHPGQFIGADAGASFLPLVDGRESLIARAAWAAVPFGDLPSSSFHPGARFRRSCALRIEGCRAAARGTRPVCASDPLRSLNLPCRRSAWSRVRAEPSGRRPCVGAGCGLHPRTHAAPYR